MKIMSKTLYLISEVLVHILPILLSVAYVTVYKLAHKFEVYNIVTKMKIMFISEPPKPYTFINTPIQSNLFYNFNKLLKRLKEKYIINIGLSILVSVSFTIFTRYIIGKEFELFYYMPFISGIGAMLCYSIITTYNCNYIKINVLIKTFIFAVIFSTFMLILIFYIKSKFFQLSILWDLWDIISLFSIILSNKLYITDNNIYDYINKDLSSSKKSYVSNSFNSVIPDNSNNNNRIRDGRSRSPVRASSSGALVRVPRSNAAENININNTNNSGALSRNIVSIPKPVNTSSVSLQARSGNAPIRFLGAYQPSANIKQTETREILILLNRNRMANPITLLDKTVSFKNENSTRYILNKEKTVELYCAIKNRYNDSLMYVNKLALMQNFANRINICNEDYMDHCTFIRSNFNIFFYKSNPEFISIINGLIGNNIDQTHYIIYKELLADNNKLTILRNILTYQGDMYSMASIYQYTKDLLGEIISLRREDFFSVDIELHKTTLTHIISLVDFLCPDDLENRQLLSNLKNNYQVITLENLTIVEVILTNLREKILIDYFKIKTEWYNNYNNISSMMESYKLDVLNNTFNFKNTYVDDIENTLTYRQWLIEHLKYFEDDLTNIKLSLSLDYDINPGLSNEDFYTELKNLGFISVITEFRNANNNYISVKSLMDKLDKNNS